MSTFTLRMDDNFKAQLEKIAEERGQSVNQLIINYLHLGRLIDAYTDSDSQVLIKDAKGFKNEQVIVPVKEVVRG